MSVVIFHFDADDNVNEDFPVLLVFHVSLVRTGGVRTKINQDILSDVLVPPDFISHRILLCPVYQSHVTYNSYF